MTSAVVDHETLQNAFSDAYVPAKSRVQPRWERKKNEAAAAAAATMGGGTGGSKKARKPLGMHNIHPQSQQQQQQGAGGHAPPTSTGDRFIPNRANMDLELSAHAIRSASMKKSGGSADDSDGRHDGEASSGSNGVSDDEYKATLSLNMLGLEDTTSSSSTGGHRILSFSEKAPQPRKDVANPLNVLYSPAIPSLDSNKKAARQLTRHIPKAPKRVLDAPDLLNDYYLNLISWSDTNVLAVALSQTVFLWNASTGDVEELCSLDESEVGPDAHISSVAWVQEGGAHIAVGTSDGLTELWDVHACRKLRTMDGHTDRVGAMSWNKHILSTGGRDSIVVNHDVRVANHQVGVLSSHVQEVCGLAWSPDGHTLASGGNDNTLCLWDATLSSTSTPRHVLTEHQAAVKGLAWSPHERHLLATGGGTADRTIKFWNARTGAMLNSVDTGSQVCALLWNPHEKELLSSHGFARNQLCLWQYPSMTKVVELSGHTERVLHLAASPDGTTVVSGAADETLRFWEIFAAEHSIKGSTKKRGSETLGSNGTKLSRAMQIR